MIELPKLDFSLTLSRQNCTVNLQCFGLEIAERWRCISCIDEGCGGARVSPEMPQHRTTLPRSLLTLGVKIPYVKH